MTIIRLTRRAIQELRDLRSGMNNHLIPNVLRELQSGESSNPIPVQGAEQVWRYKRRTGGGAYLRLFFDWKNWNQIIIMIGAKLREDAYDQNFDSLPRRPCYEWNGEDGRDWDRFLNDSYYYSAVPSEEQLEVAREACPKFKDAFPDWVGFHAVITQSPPGTGKTITAAQKACELWKAGYDVVFLLPAALVKEQVLNYRCIIEVLAQSPDHFFVGTFQQWINQRFPDFSIQIMSPNEELNFFQLISNRCFFSQRHSPITYRDVLLYQLFVLNEAPPRSSVVNDNIERIGELRSNIPTRWWYEEERNTGNHCCRIKAAKEFQSYIQNTPPEPIKNVSGTVIIIDETQDYLIEEINIIKHLCRHWQQKQDYWASLWLLGDLNQRIAPVDFDWGRLQLGKVQEPKWPNYRTTQRVLTLANRFQKQAVELVRQQGGRHLTEQTEPSSCFEVGELVKVLVYPDLEAAEKFLQPLVETVSAQMSSLEKQHSLQWRLAARARLFCSDVYHAQSELRRHLEFMPVSEAKGREFDACIAFCIFDLPSSGGQVEAYTKWYTQLTRARSRLLIVTTDSQLEAIGQDLLDDSFDDANNQHACVEYIDVDDTETVKNTLSWITELTNELQFSETETLGLREIVLSAVNQSPPLLYWDLFEVINCYRFSREEVMALEDEIVCTLYQRLPEAENLFEELQREELSGQHRLRSLILRSLGHSWQAAYQAEALKQDNLTAYEDVISGIINDLKKRGLLFESERLNYVFGCSEYLENENLRPIFEYQGSLLPALQHWVTNRLSKVFNN